MGRNRPGGGAVRGSNTSPVDPIRPPAVRPESVHAIGIAGLHAVGIGSCIERHVAGAVEATAAHLALRRDGQHIVFLDAVIETMRHIRPPGRDMRFRCRETGPGALPVDFVEP